MIHSNLISFIAVLLISSIILFVLTPINGESNVISIDKEEQNKNNNKLSSSSSSSSWWQMPKFNCFSCPTSDDYSPECLDPITPPWPICLRHSSEEWVDIAIDSIPRCCGDDLSECKCPMKDSRYFASKIDEYCDAAEVCKNEEKRAFVQKVEKVADSYTKQE
mmetsp:Transcript_13566/g.25453  ORF Transcript_13566/g.25453 Transcript_13566/m.25453 type:complete len:163 (+) Transcript_13566:499-987(+)